jgi:hypothetical protein
MKLKFGYMKLTIVVIIAIFYSPMVKAQDNKIFKRKPWEDYKQKRLLQDTFNRTFSIPPVAKNSPYENERGVLKFPLKGTYLGQKENGDKLYAMQPDKMPCLVPGKNTVFNMPVAGVGKGDLDHNLNLAK